MLLPPERLALPVIEGDVWVTDTELPITWRAAEGKRIERRFTAALPKDTLTSHENAVLYIPYYSQEVEISLNGDQVFDSFDGTAGHNPLSLNSVLLELPSAYLSFDTDIIEITVTTTEPPFGSISEVYLGTKSELFVTSVKREFFATGVKQILFGAQLLLSFCCFVIYFRRPKDAIYLWLGMTMIWTTAISLSLILNPFPNTRDWTPWLLFSTSGAAAGFTGFASLIYKPKSLGKFTYAPIALPALIVIFTFLIGSNPLSMNKWFNLPVTLVFMAVTTLLLTKCARRKPCLLHDLLLFGVIALSIAITHEVFSYLNIVKHNLLLLPFVRLLNLASFAFFLMNRLAETTKYLDVAGTILKRELDATREKLRMSFAKERQLLEVNARQEERTAIMAELHDSIAGQLSTIVAVAEAKGTKASDIVPLARTTLSDLRFILDASELEHGDLRYAMAILRAKVTPALSRLGIASSWQINQDYLTNFSASQILSILRVVQEGIHNAIKHGNPSSLTVHICILDTGVLEGKVENAGGDAIQCRTKGKGLSNIERRIRNLGGKWTLRETSSGAIMSFNIPQNLESHKTSNRVDGED